jgi:subtilisin family serine protease
MRCLSFAVACLALILGACAMPHARADSVEARHDDQLTVDAGRLIVVTVDNTSQPFLSEPGSTPRSYSSSGLYAVGDQARRISDALAHDYRLQPIREWPIAPLRVHCLVYAIPEGADRDDILRRLAADRRVKLAQPMQVFSALSGHGTGSSAAVVSASGNAPYNDPYFSLQHGFTEVDAADAQQWSRGEGVRVAIIDTGVATSHPDLRGRVTVSRNFVDGDQGSFETDRHGTEVAGIIGADANNGVGIVGIAPAVQLQVYKACQPSQPAAMDAQCNSFTLARALGAAVDAHAQIVNLSLGGPADPLLAEIVRYGLQHGIMFVGAVPEDGVLDGFPLNIGGVIAVDVIGRAGGAPAILHAPGRDIVSTAPGGSYDFVTGSSFAAAHVTGVLALLHAQRPELGADALATILTRTGTQQADGLMINACAALDAVRGNSACARVTGPAESRSPCTSSCRAAL